MDKVHWLLPEGIDEFVPPQAAQIEQLRRELLDMYGLWGYDLVMPPFIEFLDSLLMGTGADIDLKTFKLIDQISGRLMGVRADMTTQVARIDAHHLDNDSPSRLCYMGTVLHTRPNGFGGTRAPLQIGAELYGHADFQSDVEVISLMLETFVISRVENVSVDLGHVGIFRGLANEAGLNKEQEAILFNALQRKAVPEIHEILVQLDISQSLKTRILSLPDLNGDAEVIAEARQLLQGSAPCVMQAIDYVEQVATSVCKSYPKLPLHYDLAELRGYNFHTGVVFSAYVPESGVEVARGGRYDNIGSDFGRQRPATGFSTDLNTLIRYSSAGKDIQQTAVWSPYEHDDEKKQSLENFINHLRKQGKRVICELPGQQGTPEEQGCNEKLMYVNDQWVVQEI